MPNCRWSTSRPSCWAARWPTTRPRPAALALVGDMLDMGTADHYRPANRRVFRFDRRTIGDERRAVHRLRQRHDVARGFPRSGRPVCRVLHATDVSRRTSLPRCSSWPWARSPPRADDPHQEISEFFCDNLPADSPYHVVQGGKRRLSRSSRPRTCGTTTPSISCRTT